MKNLLALVAASVVACASCGPAASSDLAEECDRGPARPDPSGLCDPGCQPLAVVDGRTVCECPIRCR